MQFCDMMQKCVFGTVLVLCISCNLKKRPHYAANARQLTASDLALSSSSCCSPDVLHPTFSRAFAIARRGAEGPHGALAATAATLALEEAGSMGIRSDSRVTTERAPEEMD